jgi:hypothetical protein
MSHRDKDGRNPWGAVMGRSQRQTVMLKKKKKRYRTGECGTHCKTAAQTHTTLVQILAVSIITW